jgi:hypothetical protein
MTAARQHRVRGDPGLSHTLSVVQSPAISTTSLWPWRSDVLIWCQRKRLTIARTMRGHQAGALP